MPDPEKHLDDEPRNHPMLWILAFLFLVLSVPFYYPTGREPQLLAGLPDWCWVTLLADIGFAATVAAMILRTWKEREGSKGSENGNGCGA